MEISLSHGQTEATGADQDSAYVTTGALAQISINFTARRRKHLDETTNKSI